MRTDPALWTLELIYQDAARADVVEPTPPTTPDKAVAALKETIQDVGFESTARMAHSNRPAAKWTVSVEDLGKMDFRQVVQVVDPLQLFEELCPDGQIPVRRGN